MARLPIRADVLQVLDDWKAGKAIRSIELGHTHRIKEIPGASPVVDESQFHHRDQNRAHEFLFAIVGNAFKHEAPESHEEFLATSDVIAAHFPDLTPEEKTGAESLAWKAMRVGWQRAIAGHEFYFEVKRVEVTA